MPSFVKQIEPKDMTNKLVFYPEMQSNVNPTPKQTRYNTHRGKKKNTIV